MTVGFSDAPPAAPAAAAPAAAAATAAAGGGGTCWTLGGPGRRAGGQDIRSCPKIHDFTLYSDNARFCPQEQDRYQDTH